MKLKQLLFLSCCLLTHKLIFAALPPKISFKGIIRDFSNFHPDFESPVSWCREQPGLFMATLDSDSKPVSTPPELRTDSSLGIYRSCQATQNMTTTKYAITNFGQFYFDEYYHDVPGVNIPIPVEISLGLVDEPNAIYRFSSDAFFPLNNKGGYSRELLDSQHFLNQQKNLDSNYWFTTEIRVPFYYTGKEVFQFKGDDDLWVFIDGMLTTCDLGGIHIAIPCAINLQEMGWKDNTRHEMLILHAERHFRGSSFELTTSIVPINTPPTVNNISVNVMENSKVTFVLDGYDPDDNPDLKFLIVNGPQFGQLDVSPGVWFPSDQELTFTPPQYFNGEITLSFQMTDNLDISDIAFLKLIVTPVNTPPIPIDASLTMRVNETKSVKLEAQDIDTDQTDLRFYLASPPQLGSLTINNMTGIATYHAFYPGIETVIWQVADGSGLYAAKLTIAVTQPPAPQKAPMKPAIVIGIVVGGFILFAFISGMISYLFYMSVVAKRFQRTWEKEFYEARMMQNPLYKTARIEGMNPLYTSKESLAGNQV